MLNVTQPAVSHHMKILTQAGLVQAEKRGRWIYYRLNPAAFAEVVAFLQPFATPPAAPEKQAA